MDGLASLDDEVEARLREGARFRLSGDYAADARALRQSRRLYWDLYGEDGRNLLEEKRVGAEESRAERKARKRRQEAERKRVNLERVSQRLQLERTDLESKIAETRREFGKLARRKLVLEEEWKKVNADRASLEEEKKRFKTARKSPWFQSNILPTSDLRRVRLNVGGQLFETSEKALKRDPASLLAALVQPDSPIKPDEKGCYVIDRDWFLFRLILNFLRDGTLPEFSGSHGDQLISNLYKEAEFYNLETLRYAIREYLDPFQIVEKSAAVPLSRLHKLEAQMLHSLKQGLEDLTVGQLFDDGFKYDPPKKDKEKEKDKDDALLQWWTKSRYKGKDYSLEPQPLGEADTKWKKKGSSLEYAKQVASETMPFTSRSTWYRSLDLSDFESDSDSD